MATRPLVRTLVILVACALFAGVASAQDAAYMFIPGIPGESLGANHRDWIDLYGVDHILTAPVTVGGGQQNPGPADFSDVAVLKGTDLATPLLHYEAARRVSIGDVVIEVCREGGATQECYYRLELTNVIISGVSLAGSTCIDPATSCTPSQTESVEMSFREITWRYTPFVGGNPQPPIERCWSNVNNTDCP